MKVFSKLHSEHYESVCHSVTRGAIHCECGLPESLQMGLQGSCKTASRMEGFYSRGGKKGYVERFTLHNL